MKYERWKMKCERKNMTKHDLKRLKKTNDTVVVDKHDQYYK